MKSLDTQSKAAGLIRHSMQRRVSILGLAAVCAVSSAFAQSQPAAVKAQPLHHNLTPGVATRVAFKTLPAAVCTLSAQGSNTPQSSLKLYADEEGSVHFDATPPANVSSADSEKAMAYLEAQCLANGQLMSHSIELQPAVGIPPTISSASRNAANGTQPGQTVRPALTGDPLIYSSEELQGRGYPPRPDPVQAPDAYGTWLKAVSKPSTLITPKIVTTDRVHGPMKTYVSGGSSAGPGTSNNWSGFVLQPGPTPYNMVLGGWQVPTVTGDSIVTGYSSLWIGLDGWNCRNCGGGDSSAVADVVQDGTEQDVLSVNLPLLGVHWQLASYYAWYEWFTTSTPLEQQIQNFPVYPGDEIFSIVMVGASASAPANAYGATGSFFIEDISGGFHVQPSVSKPSADTFSGNNAEWIMERPTESACGTCTPYLPNLAKYGTAVMSGTFAQRQDGALVNYSAVSNDQLTMDDYPTVPTVPLSKVVPTSTSNMQFTWINFH